MDVANNTMGGESLSVSSEVLLNESDAFIFFACYHTKLSRASVRRQAYVRTVPSNLRIGLHTNVFSRPQLEDRRNFVNVY